MNPCLKIIHALNNTEFFKQNSPKKEPPPKENVVETPVESVPIVEAPPTDNNTSEKPIEDNASLDVDGGFEEEELSDDNDPLKEVRNLLTHYNCKEPTGKNRMASVIEKIERTSAEKGNHHGYDPEDSFIDDEGIAVSYLLLNFKI